MSEKQETIADILAEMRIFKCRDLLTGKLDVCTAVAHYFANRIEAAFKRYRECGAAAAQIVGEVGEIVGYESATGDCAKMRKALEEIAYGCCRGCGGENDQSFCDSTSCSEEVELRPIVQLAREALAAPVRNCDKYITPQEAWDAWLNNESNWDEFGSPEKEIYEWLLSPVKESEVK